MALHGRQAMVFALLLGLAGLAAAARLPEQQQVVGSEDPHSHVEAAAAAEPPSSSASSRSLLTYYFDATQPRVQLSARSSRPERTAITVTLPRPQSVSRFMPVVSPRPTGMIHEVANTWQALKNLAVMFSHVDALNTAAGPPATRLFPRAALAVSAASDNAPGKLDVNAIITYAQAQGQHSSWAETTPGSVLLLPFGQSTGAVADVMGAAYDAQADSITLELDIVHQPHTISEFDPHGKQTVEVDQAHYHFDTAPGVKVDAQGLIKSLQSSGAAVEGLHLFLKGNTCGDQTCVTAIVEAPTTAAVEESITVRVTLSDLNCGKRRTSNGGAPASNIKDGPSIQTSTTFQSFYLAIVGSGAFGGLSSRQGPLLTRLTTDDQGTATTTAVITGSGPVSFVVTGFDASDSSQISQVNYATVNGCSGGGVAVPIAKLQLVPAKAYRHVHDSLTLTALALDASNNPVAGATVVFSAESDCNPTLGNTQAVTDANGHATFTVVANQPGVVSVVAAGVNAEGAAVVSAPSHIFFYGNRYDADEREEGYYRRYGSGDDDSEAYRYSKAAAARAVELITRKST